MNLTKQKVPNHIAIIMDGNRRWARKQGLKIIKGHDKVAREVIEKLIDRCIELNIKYLTLWAFSTENWNRDKKEVSGLMKLFREVFETSSSKLHKKGVQIRTIGDLSRFAPDIRKGIEAWVEETKKNDKVVLTYALNYGGKDEIMRAANKMIADLIDQDKIKQFDKSKQNLITQELFAKYLDTKDLPDPSLLIRPGGEKRLSGFLPWQSIYTELYFTDVLMPDFDGKELDKAVEEFQKRQRRFGQ